MAHRGSPKFAKYARGSFATKAYLAHFSIREIAELLAWWLGHIEPTNMSRAEPFDGLLPNESSSAP